MKGNRKTLFIAVGLFALQSATAFAQTLTLDDCRTMALKHNKSLLISEENRNAAYYERKAAYTNYLPKLSVTAGYIRNQREISLLNDRQKSKLSNMGTNVQTNYGQQVQNIAKLFPDLEPLISSLTSFGVTGLNKLGQSVVNAFRSDTRNMYAGTLTLTQPLYMGGKIRAYNEITRYAEALAASQQATEMQDVILDIDQAYWQVVSLSNKKNLAESYLALLQHLDSDVQKMVKEGVATRADELSVHVKLNEAEMTVTKVDDGLSLSKMLLCQLCGMDLHSPIVLADEKLSDLPVTKGNSRFNMDSVYSHRPELQSLELATQIYDQKVKITRSDYLPHAALLGNYLVSNPSLYNGFEKKFKGMWSVGVTLTMPVWTWGENKYKIRKAKAEANIARLKLDDTREKVELQVNQSAFQVEEATKRLTMALKNMDKAEENLHHARVGFKAGVIPTSNLLEAQTAWLQAHSEKIDAQIDVKLSEITLRRSTGELGNGLHNN